MTATDITHEAVRQALARGCSRPPETIDMERTFAENDFDSVDLLAIVFELTDAFDIMIPSDAMDALLRSTDGQQPRLNALIPLLASLRHPAAP
ncbi:MAG: acyl carrier protein [Magnetococcales bacterium]|nr:acyl carrier protein [Magnetococcales bacterium]